MAGIHYNSDLCSTAICMECCGCEQYDKALEDLLKVMKERAEDCSDIPNAFDKGYYQAYEHMCYEAEQLKK